MSDERAHVSLTAKELRVMVFGFGSLTFLGGLAAGFLLGLELR